MTVGLFLPPVSSIDRQGMGRRLLLTCIAAIRQIGNGASSPISFSSGSPVVALTVLGQSCCPGEVQGLLLSIEAGGGQS